MHNYLLSVCCELIVVVNVIFIVNLIHPWVIAFFGPVGFDIDDIIKTKISVGFGFIKSHEFSFTIMMMMMMMTMFSVWMIGTTKNHKSISNPIE